MPGMVNPHCHMGMSVFRGLAEDVDDRLYRYILPLERKFVTPDMVRVGSRAVGARADRGRRHHRRRHVLFRNRSRPTSVDRGRPARRRRPDPRRFRSARPQELRRRLRPASKNWSTLSPTIRWSRRRSPRTRPTPPDVAVMERVARLVRTTIPTCRCRCTWPRARWRWSGRASTHGQSTVAVDARRRACSSRA